MFSYPIYFRIIFIFLSYLFYIYFRILFIFLSYFHISMITWLNGCVDDFDWLTQGALS